MSHLDNAHTTKVMADKLGFRWCSSCQADKASAGFVKQGTRWICTGCQARRQAGAPSHSLSSSKRGIRA